MSITIDSIVADSIAIASIAIWPKVIGINQKRKIGTARRFRGGTGRGRGKCRPVLIGRLHGGKKPEHLLKGGKSARQFRVIQVKMGKHGGFPEIVNFHESIFSQVIMQCQAYLCSNSKFNCSETEKRPENYIGGPV
ncbi:MAG: hypothetical protein LBU21_09435, partial [Treponema sp.]|nr:hypothetical protein [Treponema sp.]